MQVDMGGWVYEYPKCSHGRPSWSCENHSGGSLVTGKGRSGHSGSCRTGCPASCPCRCHDRLASSRFSPRVIAAILQTKDALDARADRRRWWQR